MKKNVIVNRTYYHIISYNTYTYILPGVDNSLDGFTITRQVWSKWWTVNCLEAKKLVCNCGRTSTQKYGFTVFVSSVNIPGTPGFA